jgi:hypothetical protein
MNTETESAWERLDRAALGVIYGSITVLSILLAAGDHPDTPFKTAFVLFGSTFAVTLAKAFAELLSKALDRGERMTRASWRTAWAHSRPTLVTANMSTLFFVAAGFGLMTPHLASTLSQAICVVFLMVLGARVGWVLDRRVVPSILGAAFAGGIGLVLAALKFVIH